MCCGGGQYLTFSPFFCCPHFFCCFLPAEAEAELEALRIELDQQQADLARRAAALAAAAKEGAAQVRQ
jgi:hypothetical protein